MFDISKLVAGIGNAAASAGNAVAPNTQRQKTGWIAAAAITVTLVAGFEGYASKPYVDRVGTGHPITWCYGETKADGTPVPPMNRTFTKTECQESLLKKLTEVYDPMVRQCIDTHALDGHPHREASLVSFIYNGGQGWLCAPRVRKPWPDSKPIRYTAVAANINAGNYVKGCNAMNGYVMAAGRVLPGLQRRRGQEAQWCRMDN